MLAEKLVIAYKFVCQKHLNKKQTWKKIMMFLRKFYGRVLGI